MNGEKEKIQFALELAIHEVERRRRPGETDADDDPNETKGSVKPDRQKTGTITKKAYLGTNLLIKLPYIIGSAEYTAHPFAGVVFAKTGDEQVELFKEEQAQIEEDRKKEQKEL